MTQQQPVNSCMSLDLGSPWRGCFVCTPGLSRQSREKRFIQKHLESKGAKYVRNFMMKYKDVNSIFHSTFMCFYKILA